MAIKLIRLSADQYQAKVWQVGQYGDRMYGDRLRGQLFQMTLAELEQRFPQDASMVVLPEGISLNYLSRRLNPTPYINFMPPELILFGEAKIQAALEAHPQAAVVLAHKDTSEYGVPFFGRDYGQGLGAWVLERFRHRWTDPNGCPPLTPGTEFGMSLLERKP